MTNIPNELELILKVAQETTGEQYGISVPLLELEIRNISARPLAVPKEGDSLLSSIRLSLTQGGRTVYHGPPGQTAKLELDPLFPGKTKREFLSPLGHGLSATSLEPGVYEARVRVTPQSHLSFNSTFAAEFGDVCSNMVQLTVKRIKKSSD
ncbi:MAG: hypothetical protein K6U80_02655 [Firmicutes bacterium]|nr:hypothetical protein [Bacillota bacterium]